MGRKKGDRSGIPNLRSIGLLNEDDKREFTSKGGIASGQVRRDKRDFRELFELCLSGKINDEKLIMSAKKLFPHIPKDELTIKMAVTIKVIQRALGNDFTSNSAFVLLRDAVGEKPVEKTELTGANGLSLSLPQPIINILPVSSKKDG